MARQIANVWAAVSAADPRVLVAHYAAQRRAGDGERAHTPTATYAEQLERFHLPVRDEGVPAEQVIHVMDPVEAGQVRGLSAFAPMA